MVLERERRARQGKLLENRKASPEPENLKTRPQRKLTEAGAAEARGGTEGGKQNRPAGKSRERGDTR